MAGCGPINVHVFENVGKRDGLETRATDDGLQTRPTSDPRAKVKLLLAGEVAPWDGVLITRSAFDAMADAAMKVGLETRATNDGLQTRPTNDGLETRATNDGLQTRPTK